MGGDKEITSQNRFCARFSKNGPGISATLMAGYCSIKLKSDVPHSYHEFAIYLEAMYFEM